MFLSVILCTGDMISLPVWLHVLSRGYDVTSCWSHVLSSVVIWSQRGPTGGVRSQGVQYAPSTDICWWPLKHAVRILLECILVGFESRTRGEPWVVRSQANLSLIFKNNGAMAASYEKFCILAIRFVTWELHPWIIIYFCRAGDFNDQKTREPSSATGQSLIILFYQQRQKKILSSVVHSASYFNFLSLPPSTRLRQGNIFTPVCHSFHRGWAWWGRAWQGVCMVGVCVVGGGAVCGRGACMARGYEIRSISGRCAFYWKAYLW